LSLRTYSASSTSRLPSVISGVSYAATLVIGRPRLAASKTDLVFGGELSGLCRAVALRGPDGSTDYAYKLWRKCLCSNMRSTNVDDMDDVDFSGWDLPPLDDVDLPTEPPPPRESIGGVTFGSELVGIQLARAGEVSDVVKAALLGFTSVRPGLLGIAELGSTDFAALTATERVDALIVLEQQRAWLDGLQQQLLADVAMGDTSKEKWAREEVAAALGLAPVTAGSRLKNAEQLCRRLPATLDALLAGRITAMQATAITEASYVLTDEVLPAFEDRVLKRAPEQTLAQLKQSVRRAVLRFDPASAEQRRQRAAADRSVRISDAGDGMAWLTALLPAPQAKACCSGSTPPPGWHRPRIRGRWSSCVRTCSSTRS
jgi:hypothetical protein